MIRDLVIHAALSILAFTIPIAFGVTDIKCLGDSWPETPPVDATPDLAPDLPVNDLTAGGSAILGPAPSPVLRLAAKTAPHEGLYLAVLAPNRLLPATLTIHALREPDAPIAA